MIGKYFYSDISKDTVKVISLVKGIECLIVDDPDKVWINPVGSTAFFGSSKKIFNNEYIELKKYNSKLYKVINNEI